MNNIINKLVIALLIIILASSCASIFTRTNYPVSFNSSPSEAEITILNRKGQEVFVGKTPATVVLSASSSYFRAENYTIKFSLSKHDDRSLSFNAKIEPWYFANIILGGVIGMVIIDPLTGAMWKMPEKTISVDLKPANHVEKPLNDDEAILEIVDIKDIAPELRGELIRIN